MTDKYISVQSIYMQSLKQTQTEICIYVKKKTATRFGVKTFFLCGDISRRRHIGGPRCGYLHILSGTVPFGII